MSIHPEEATTNFYRVLQVRQVKYAIYVASSAKNEQVLLEAELYMRNQYKRGLFHHTTKELWAFGLNDEEVPVPLPKFNMKCKDSNIVSPSSIFSSSDGSRVSKPLYRILLSSIKRKILINLSLNNHLTPFGDGSLLTTGPNNFSECLFIDPQISTNGDVLVSAATRRSNLFSLIKYVSLPKMNKASITNSKIAVYLAPSGIRAHFANDNLADSLTPTPGNCQSLLIMLHLLIGIAFNKKLNEVKWVKLVPNLKHINGLTPQISKYLEPAANFKFVIWPLDLCFGQFSDSDTGASVSKSSSIDPMTVLDEFWDLNSMTSKVIAAHQLLFQQLTSQKQHSGASENDIEPVVKNEQQPVMKVEKPESPKMEGDVEFDTPTEQGNNWTNLDEELFGENSEIADADFNFFDDDDEDDESATLPASVTAATQIALDEPVKNDVDIDIDAKTPEKENGKHDVVEEEMEKQSMSYDTDSMFFDIPKDEMCLPPTPYNDPGAPLPIDTTPTSISSQSVFSPLKFNPAIKVTVDNKYGKGGKFHVPDTKDFEKQSEKMFETTNTTKDYSIVVHSSDEDLTSDSESGIDADDDLNDDDDDDDDEDDEDGHYGSYEKKFASDFAPSSQENRQDPSNSHHGSNQPSSGFKIELDTQDFGSASDTNQGISGLAIIDSLGTKPEGGVSYQNINTPELPSTKIFTRLEQNTSNYGTPSDMTVSPNTSGDVKIDSKTGHTVKYEFSNWVQFLTKWVPLYTIPEKFFVNNPSVTELEMKSILPFLVNLIAFDGSLLETTIAKTLRLKDEPLRSLADYDISFKINSDKSGDLEDEISISDFEDYFSSLDANNDCYDTSNHNENEEGSRSIESALKDLFTSVKKMKLYEYIGLTNYDETKDEIINIANTDDNELDDSLMSGNDFLHDDETTYTNEIQEHIFKIDSPVCEVKRGNSEVIINLSALKMWRALSLAPLHPARNVKLLFVVNDEAKNSSSSNYLQFCKWFISAVSRSYDSCGLGKCELFEGSQYSESDDTSVDENESASFLLSIRDGVLNIGHNNSSSIEYYDFLNKKLESLGQIISKSNQLDNSAKLIILFANEFVDLNSILKITASFSLFYSHVERPNTAHRSGFQIIPTNFYLSGFNYRTPSQQFLTKFSLSLYNNYDCESLPMFSQLVSSTPTPIKFQLTTEPVAKTIMNEDQYLHLAYERSADKNWCVACWTDQWGKQKKVRSWYCFPFGNLPKLGNTKSNMRKTFEEVTNEMWQETLDFEKKCGGSRKSYLVLTRLKGVILDDELTHWKRLSSGSNVQIILLTVSLNPRLILKDFGCPYPFNKLYGGENGKSNACSEYFPDTTTKDGDMLIREKYSFQELESGDISSHELRIVDSTSQFYGVILKNPIPLPNSVNKITFKSGYLIRPVKSLADERLVTFELNLLSHPSYLDHNTLLNNLLKQFRNLVAINEMLGNEVDANLFHRYGQTDTDLSYASNPNTVSNDSVFPWHVRAVQKVMSVLTHIRVE